MQITPLALAFSEWGIGRFPLGFNCFPICSTDFCFASGNQSKKDFC